jgi:hypothetical protein
LYQCFKVFHFSFSYRMLFYYISLCLLMLPIQLFYDPGPPLELRSLPPICLYIGTLFLKSSPACGESTRFFLWSSGITLIFRCLILA